MLLRQVLFQKLNLVYNLNSKRTSFKVLHYKLNADESQTGNAVKKSNSAQHALKFLSNFAMSGGGPKSIQRHTVINKKLLVRHRLKLLFDPDSPLLEIGLLAGLFMDYGTIPAAGGVSVIGKIHGHYCVVNANDATVKGGTFFPISIVKQTRVQQLALLNHLPCIYLVDSGGAYLPLQAEIFPDKEHGGRTFYNEAVLSSLGIPQIALVCGSCTAGGAYCPTMAEEAIIVKNTGTIFLGGPPLVKAATGEVVSEQDLGGAEVHCSISGCTDYFAENEEAAFEMCRESIEILNLPNVPEVSIYKEPLYPGKDLLTISGKDMLSKDDMYLILSRILDGSEFKEFKQKFGKKLIAGFGYIQGILVGVLANYGSLEYQDGQKGAHLIQLCDKRNIPLIFLQNSGSVSESNINLEQANLLNDRAKMVAAHSCVNIPKITLNVGGCYSDDNYTMCGIDFNPNFFLSWPLAHVSLAEKLEALENEDKSLEMLSGSTNLSDYDVLFEDKTSAFYNASNMLCDGLVNPVDTREILAMCLKIVKRKMHLSEPTKKSSAVLRM